MLGAEMPDATPSQSELLLFAKQQQQEAEFQRELENERRRQEREAQLQQLSLAAPEPLARVSGGGGTPMMSMPAGPALEVTVMRVVGCEVLTSGMTGRDFCVVTYAGSRPGGSGWGGW